MTAAVAVVVPARDAEATLGRTLRALAAQADAPPHEVVVVDNGSVDGTGAVARAAGVRVVTLPRGGGPGPARNAGVAAAPPGAALAFTDADCFPAPDWLAAGARALADADLVQGRVIPDPQAPRGPYDRTVSVGGESGLYETANLFVARSAFERAGGFDGGIDAGPRPFGEDVRFAWRALRAGARGGYCPEALVHHAVFPRGPRGYVTEQWRRRHFPRLIAEVPELAERFLWHRAFLTPRSAAFDLALLGAGLAAAHRSPLPLAAALPYARHLWGHGHGPRALAIEVAADAAGAAGLVAGSLSARRLVL